MLSITEIVANVRRDAIWNRSAVSPSPLVGTVDGVNRLFSTPSAPIDESTLVVYDSTFTSLVLGTNYTVLDDRTGSILFSVAPVVAPIATYSVTELTTLDLQGLVASGVEEASHRINVELYLVGAGGAAQVSSDPVDVIDPVVTAMDGSTSYLSQSRRFFQFISTCSRYRIALSMYERALSGSMSYREERTGGLMVDTTKTPAGWKSLVDALSLQVDNMAAELLRSYGSSINGPKTDWLKESKSL